MFSIFCNRYITSDCDAVATIYEDQNYTSSPEDAAAAALKAGCLWFYSTLLIFPVFFFNHYNF